MFWLFKKHVPNIRPLAKKIIDVIDNDPFTWNLSRKNDVDGLIFTFEIEEPNLPRRFKPHEIKLVYHQGNVLIHEMNERGILHKDQFNRDEKKELISRLEEIKRKSEIRQYNIIENTIAYGLNKRERWK